MILFIYSQKFSICKMNFNNTSDDFVFPFSTYDTEHEKMDILRTRYCYFEFISKIVSVYDIEHVEESICCKPVPAPLNSNITLLRL